MKKVLLIVVVAALALTLVPLAIAGAPGGGGWKHGKAKFNLVGEVAPDVVDPAVDRDAAPVAADVVDPVAAVVSTITIKVKAGTKSIRRIRGEVTEFIGGRRQGLAAHRGRRRRRRSSPTSSLATG